MAVWAAGILCAGASASCGWEVDDDERAGGSRSASTHCDGPTIDAWYGETPSSGLLGHAQRQLNLLGNVSDPDGVVSLEHSLNGGALVTTPIGPGPVRLQNAGDFNIGIDRSLLLDGTNTLDLRAENGVGEVCTRRWTIDHDASSVWPLPYRMRFDSIATAEEIDQVAEVVDGLWEVGPDGLHIVEPGYDRLLAVGDASWPAGYRVRTTVTVHDVSTWGGVGLAIGWQGHEGTDDPPTDWPVGALGWVRNKGTGPELEIRTFDAGTPASTDIPFPFPRTYLFDVRGEPIGGGRMAVSVVLWDVAAGGAPVGMLSAEVDARDGSVLLVAHVADVTWHDVDIEPLGMPDGGVPDAGPPDAGPPDSGPPDAGPPDSGPPDAGPPDSGPPDAGPPDAGPPDAGPPDAGPPDAGPPDAGPPDAGPPDAGPPDAGPPDAGPPDAGPPDAGPPDAGPPDAGPPDAGPPDAGPPDAGPPDAGPPDAGPPDAGPADAGPPDTGPPDAGLADAGPPDAGPPDAGPSVPPDAFVPRTDGGPEPGDGGCSCAVPARRAGSLWIALLGLSLTVIRRARRRTRMSRKWSDTSTDR